MTPRAEIDWRCQHSSWGPTTTKPRFLLHQFPGQQAPSKTFLVSPRLTPPHHKHMQTHPHPIEIDKVFLTSRIFWKEF